MQTKELASGLLICEGPNVPEKPTIKDYWALHCRCPQCGQSEEFESTCVGGPLTDLESYRDRNRTTCPKCGWCGIGHDLIPKADPAELKDFHSRGVATGAFIALWDALRLSNTSIPLPGLDERRAIWEGAAKKILGYGIPRGETL